jgi:hypothetical protein
VDRGEREERKRESGIERERGGDRKMTQRHA